MRRVRRKKMLERNGAHPQTDSSTIMLPPPRESGERNG
jgi:hypothetical protein